MSRSTQADASDPEGPPYGRLPLPEHNWSWFLVRGLLAIALAIIIMIVPRGGLFTFTLVLAAFALVDGIASLISGIRGAGAGERWGALVLRGVSGVLVGVLFVLMPVLATLTYAFLSVLILAVWCLIAGASELSAAVRLRKEIKGEWLLALAGIFSFALGIAILTLILTDPAATVISAASLIVMYAWGSGIVLILQALRLRRRTAR